MPVFKQIWNILNKNLSRIWKKN